MKKFRLKDRSFAKAKLQATSLWLVAAIIVITAMVFTACIKKSETQKDFSIYGVWRHTGGADVEHGTTWTSDGVTTFSFFSSLK